MYMPGYFVATAACECLLLNCIVCSIRQLVGISDYRVCYQCRSSSLRSKTETNRENEMRGGDVSETAKHSASVVIDIREHCYHFVFDHRLRMCSTATAISNTLGMSGSWSKCGCLVTSRYRLALTLKLIVQ